MTNQQLYRSLDLLLETLASRVQIPTHGSTYWVDWELGFTILDLLTSYCDNLNQSTRCQHMCLEYNNFLYLELELNFKDTKDLHFCSQLAKLNNYKSNCVFTKTWNKKTFSNTLHKKIHVDRLINCEIASYKIGCENSYISNTHTYMVGFKLIVFVSW